MTCRCQLWAWVREHPFFDIALLADSLHRPFDFDSDNLVVARVLQDFRALADRDNGLNHGSRARRVIDHAEARRTMMSAGSDFLELQGRRSAGNDAVN